MTAATIGGTLLFLSGLTLAGTVIALIMATPVLVLFSPIFVPAAIAVFLATVGFLFSRGCGVTTITVLTWICSYVKGKLPPGADHLDYARTKIADKARDMTAGESQRVWAVCAAEGSGGYSGFLNIYCR